MQDRRPDVRRIGGWLGEDDSATQEAKLNYVIALSQTRDNKRACMTHHAEQTEPTIMAYDFKLCCFGLHREAEPQRLDPRVGFATPAKSHANSSSQASYPGIPKTPRQRTLWGPRRRMEHLEEECGKQQRCHTATRCATSLVMARSAERRHRTTP